MKVLIVSDNIIVEEKIRNIFLKYENLPVVNYKIINSDKLDVNNFSYDLIISAHSKKIFPKELVKSVRCINIHPGFNPINRGWVPHVFSIINKTLAGATIHVMDEKIDNGPIICRESIHIESDDDSFSLYSKIIECEINLFDRYYHQIINNTYTTFLPEETGCFHSKDYYESIKNIDLSNIDTFENHINLLRALTHKDYNNAFYFDKNNTKIFLKLILKKETL